ncbi:MAG: ThuA domain-containing protein [Actinomycetaceae bacterium]|nr:ThuA domain-containing protein [Actinomycetaceae bacterium]
MNSPKALILSGHGRYSDQWHDHAGVSHELAKFLDGMGVQTTVRAMLQGCTEGIDDFDLVVVNGGWGRVEPKFDGTDEDWLPDHERFYKYAKSGKGILVYHQGINSFTDSPYWEEIVGGKWVRGTTYHPKISDAHFHVIEGAHPITDGFAELNTYDERYTKLVVGPTVTALVTHHEIDQDWTVVWVNEAGGVKVVYDALGHLPEAIAHPQRRELLRREFSWLLDRDLREE